MPSHQQFQMDADGQIRTVCVWPDGIDPFAPDTIVAGSWVSFPIDPPIDYRSGDVITVTMEDGLPVVEHIKRAEP